MLPAMIEATGLTKRLGGRTVVSDVSFRCEPGTVTGFLGPNGAGKTTTMRMLVGLSTPDAGSSPVLDRDYHATRRTRAGASASCSTRPPSTPAARGREALAVSAQMMGVPEPRVDELLDARRARQVRRAASACASTRSACASGSGSRTRCSATRRC